MTLGRGLATRASIVPDSQGRPTVGRVVLARPHVVATLVCGDGPLAVLFAMVTVGAPRAVGGTVAPPHPGPATPMGVVDEADMVGVGRPFWVVVA